LKYDRNNIFARILRGEIPAARVYEDQHTLAFMDVMPQSEGHTLVIPKVEAVDIFDLPTDGLKHLVLTTQHVARGVRAAFAPAGVMLAQLNGSGAGQSVFHIHFHIIPRHAGADMKLHARDMVDMQVLEAHAARIRACLQDLG